MVFRRAFTPLAVLGVGLLLCMATGVQVVEGVRSSSVASASRHTSGQAPIQASGTENQVKQATNAAEANSNARSITAELLKQASGIAGSDTGAGFASYLKETSRVPVFSLETPKPAAAPAQKPRTILRRRIIKDNSTQLPYPNKNMTEPIKHSKYVAAHRDPRDTTRHGVGKPGDQRSFPIPYALFAQFDKDKSGELNYKEFLKLMNYVNNDYVLPRHKRRATYRVLVDTVNSTLYNQSVYITFLGPTGQSSKETLLKNGFTVGHDVLVVESEDVSVVTNVRLRLDPPTRNVSEAWRVNRLVVEVHGRLSESSNENPFRVRHALHVSLKPAELNLNDTISQ